MQGQKFCINLRIMTALQRIVDLYVDGFRSMKIGRTLWLIIIIKVIVMFAILKFFFFPDVLKRDYPDDESRAQAVREALTTNH